MWMKERQFTKEELHKQKDFCEGFYMFGGMNNSNECMNDLWLIKPACQSNKRFINERDFSYMSKDPELTLNISKINNFKGQPPCPRSQFSMTSVKCSKSGH